MDNEVDVTTMTDAEPEESEAEEFDRGCTRCARQFAILTTAERNLAARSRSLLLADLLPVFGPVITKLPGFWVLLQR